MCVSVCVSVSVCLRASLHASIVCLQTHVPVYTYVYTVYAKCVYIYIYTTCYILHDYLSMCLSYRSIDVGLHELYAGCTSLCKDALRSLDNLEAQRTLNGRTPKLKYLYRNPPTSKRTLDGRTPKFQYLYKRPLHPISNEAMSLRLRTVKGPRRALATSCLLH